MKNVIEYLKKRSFFDQISSDEILKDEENSLKVYVGFDPTADSLHLGNLVGIIALKWFQKFGHTPVAIIGGATGRIGDPSGKSIERPFLSEDIIKHNVESITQFLRKILSPDGGEQSATVLNNNDWYKEFNIIDFLRDSGKYFRLSTMLAKESVKLRMVQEEGLSFTEFSYQVLQGYDFYHLYKHHGITVQMGGSDQWGNITAGIEFARKKCGKSLFGLTFPLITRSDGKKFGKSEGGAIWLDEKKLSYYQFYQYLIKMPDSDVIRLLKMLTFLDLEKIDDIEKDMQKPGYIPNTAQKILAAEVTRFVHGEEGLQIAIDVTSAAQPGKDIVLDVEVLQQIEKALPTVEMKKNDVVDDKYTNLLFNAGLCASKSEAVRLVKNNGAYINNIKVDDVDYKISQKDLVGNIYIVIGQGKKKKTLIKII